MSRATREWSQPACGISSGGVNPLGVLWEAARQLDPDVIDESALPGAREGHLGRAVRGGGPANVEHGSVSITVEHASFDEWWEPFTLGVGPAGAYVAGLDDEERATLREGVAKLLPDAPFTMHARAWAARGVV